MISSRVSPPVLGPAERPSLSASGRATADDAASTRLADSWFSMLDQRCFRSGADRWTALVTGIHLAGRDIWIQLECALNVHRSLVLHITPETTLHDVVSAIEATAGEPAR